MPLGTVGKDGSFRLATVNVGRIDSWNLDLGIGNREITGYGETAKSFNYTVKEWSGSASGILDNADVSQQTMWDQFTDGTLASVALRMLCTSSSTCAYWVGNAYLKGMPITSKVDDRVSVSFNFQGTGDLAWTSSSA